VDEVRLLPLHTADGAHNMAADEALLHSAVAGQASLRFYQWSEATLSLGYFQAAAARLSDPRLAPLPFVRRASGGHALLHHLEITYALALPEEMLRRGADWANRVHSLIQRAFESLGVPLEVATSARHDPSTVLCFRHISPGDLLCDRAKVVGSSQRKHRQCLLQHGGILLARSPHTPSLPGIRELTGKDVSPTAARAALVVQFTGLAGWRIIEQPWTTEERTLIDRLVREKYATSNWNEKR
jgi:lipoate-protein ligase A